MPTGIDTTDLAIFLQLQTSSSRAVNQPWSWCKSQNPSSLIKLSFASCFLPLAVMKDPFPRSNFNMCVCVCEESKSRMRIIKSTFCSSKFQVRGWCIFDERLLCPVQQQPFLKDSSLRGWLRWRCWIRSQAQRAGRRGGCYMVCMCDCNKTRR